MIQQDRVLAKSDYQALVGERRIDPEQIKKLGGVVNVPAVTRDSVYHPPHYAQWKMEPIEFIAINNLPWWLANVIKYTMRFEMKDGLKDLYKARSYLDMKIRQIEGVARFWDKPVTEENRAAYEFMMGKNARP